MGIDTGLATVTVINTRLAIFHRDDRRVLWDRMASEILPPFEASFVKRTWRQISTNMESGDTKLDQCGWNERTPDNATRETYAVAMNYTETAVLKREDFRTLCIEFPEMV